AATDIVMVPLNPALTPAELEWQLGHADARLLLFGADLAATAAALPGDRIRRELTLADLPAAPLTPRADPDAPMVQMYTSGTTGTPKGALLTEAHLIALVDAWLREMPLGPGDRTLQVTPLFHVGALMMVLCNVVAGATLVLPPGFAPRAALRLLADAGVTHTLMVPAMARWMLMEPEAATATFPTLRAFVYGAAPMPAALLRRAREAFRCDLLQGYGLTETAGVLTVLRPADHARPELAAAAGRPLVCCEVAVVDAAGAPLPAGEVGEVVARGANVSGRYAGLPDDTALRDGWFHTGDAGYLDAEGYLFLVDRLKDMILVGGENVYSREVEAALEAHPDVAEVAVIGTPHEVFGEAVTALVVPRPGVDADALPRALIRHCRARLARFKCPTVVEICASLPRNAAGKLRKAELRAARWAHLDRRIG
ncbi:MAG TPA: AMP-binding protein, partial [Myxococcota bacterium]|nr:AMP-binding protein [Myxococcota bacterium]